MKLATPLVVAVATVGLAQRGGPPGIFHDSAPTHTVSVVQCDPAPEATTLSFLAPNEVHLELKTDGTPAQRTIDLKPNAPFAMRVTGIKSGSKYTIHGLSGDISGEFSLPKAGPTRFVVQADSHLDQNTSTEVYAKSLGQMAAWKPAFMVDLGDTFMNDKHSPYQSALRQYQVQHYFLGLVGANAPVFLTLGNHDGEQGWDDRNRAGIDGWSRDQRLSHFPPVTTPGFASGNTRSANYYAFQWGEALCVVLDPYSKTPVKPGRAMDNWGWTLGNEQYKWLTHTLQSSQSRFKFVFIHQLVGGKDRDSRGGVESSRWFEWGGKNVDESEGFTAHRPGWGMPLHELFVRSHVQVVFHGHDHLYAHQQRDGIHYQLVPQPSSAHGDSIRSASDYGYTSGTILPSPGFMRVTCGTEEASVELVRPNGEVADSYTVKP